MSIPIPPGVYDVLPEDPKEIWRSSYLWSYLESKIRETARHWGYQEIRTPIFERTELFARGVGATSDIVSKEMYTFMDKGNRSMSLRPEGTAPVLRSFIENHLDQKSTQHKLFYIGPMFRYERTQLGRYRQHYQFGAEAIGLKNPEQDVELIDLLWTLYQRLGLKNLHLQLNSIGGNESRLRYKSALQDYLKQYYDDLSEDSKNRFEKNPLRILDSKDLKDRAIVENAPSILDYLSDACTDHFEEVKRLLNELNIPYEVNPHLVRGLDYYNNTVFEIIAKELGAQNSIGGGGRYDGLIKELGGPDLPAIGFGTGLERILQTMIKQEVSLPERISPLLYLIPLGEKAKRVCYSLMRNLRLGGLPIQMDFSGKKLSKAMQYADQLGSRFVAVVGDQEIESEEVELKEMSSGSQLKAPLFHLSRILRIELQKEEFIQMWSELVTPFEKSTEVDFFLNRISHSISQTSQSSGNLRKAVEEMKQFLKE